MNCETVYHYIREGKLVASKLGRTYRIPSASLNLLHWATRTRKDLSLREYTGQEIEDLIRADQLDEEAQEIARQFTKAIRRRDLRQSNKTTRYNQPA